MEFMNTKSFSKVALATSFAFALTACGEDTQIRLDTDLNYEASKLYVLSDVKNTMFDPDHFKKVAETFTTSSDFMTSSSAEDSKKAIEQIAVMKENMKAFDIPEEQKNWYSNAFAEAEKTHQRFIEFYADLYETKLDQYAAETYPELMEEINEYKSKIAGYKKAIQPAQEQLAKAKQVYAERQKQKDAEEERIEAEAGQFVIDNEILVPLKDISVYSVVYDRRLNENGQCDKDELGEAVYLKSTKLCYIAQTKNNTNKMSRFSDTQAKAFEDIIMKNSASLNKVSIQYQESMHLLGASKRNLKNAVLLATNKFGKESTLSRELWLLHRKLSNKTSNAFDDRKQAWRRFDKERKITHASIQLTGIINDIKEKEGLPVYSYEKEYHIFNPKNASPVLEYLTKQDLENAKLYDDINDEGLLKTNGDIAKDALPILILDTKEEKAVAGLSHSIYTPHTEYALSGSDRNLFKNTSDPTVIAADIAKNKYRHLHEFKTFYKEKI